MVTCQILFQLCCERYTQNYKHIPMERNQIADCIAKMTTIRCIDLQVFEVILEDLPIDLAIDVLVNFRLF